MKRFLAIFIACVFAGAAMSAQTYVVAVHDVGRKDAYIFADSRYYGVKPVGDADLRVLYDHKFVTDTVTGNAVTVEYLLLSGGAVSKYSVKGKEDYVASLKEGRREGSKYLSEVYFAVSHDAWYVDWGKGSLTFSGRLGAEDYMFTEPLSVPEWELADTTVSYGGYECRMARAEVGGEEWEVLYVPDIPSMAGPWRLYGLPGLVVHARDSRGNNEFTATFVGPVEEEITMPDYSYIKVNRSRYYKMLREWHEHYYVFQDNHTASVKISIGHGSGYKDSPLAYEPLL